MLATSTAAFGIELIAVVGNGGFWTIQLLSSTTAAFEMLSFTTPAIELIQKPAFPTSAFGSVISRAFFPSSYSDCPSDAAIVVPLLLRSSCPFSPSLLLLFFCFFSSSRLLLHFPLPLHLALLPPSPAGASSSPDSVVFSSSARRFFAIPGNASCPMLTGCS